MDGTDDYNHHFRHTPTCKTQLVTCPGLIDQVSRAHFFPYLSQILRCNAGIRAGH